MEVTVLTDNISIDSLQSEWGLSFFIEYGDRKILLYTGHCTGDKAFLILKELLGDSVEQFYCGMQVSL